MVQVVTTLVVNYKKRSSIMSTVCTTNLVGVLFQPYYGLVLEYFTFKEIFALQVLLSKYHLDFMKRNENKKLIQRLMENSFGVIFKLSSAFTEFYYDPINTPYDIIPLFYALGLIQEIAFPKYHESVMRACSTWKKGYDMNYWHVTPNNYASQHSLQYNAINYDKIPFDFLKLCKLESAELLIHWIQFVMNQKHNDFNKTISGVHDIMITNATQFLSDFDDPLLTITGIIDYDKTKGVYGNCMSFLCVGANTDWPPIEFKRMIDFLMANSRHIHIDDFCCNQIAYFIPSDGYERKNAMANYEYYIEKCVGHHSVSNRSSKEILSDINQSIPDHPRHSNLFRTFTEVVKLVDNACTSDSSVEKEAEAMRIKQVEYCKRLFVTIANFLRNNCDESDIDDWLEEGKDYMDTIDTRYYRLFCDDFGFAMV